MFFGPQQGLGFLLHARSESLAKPPNSDKVSAASNQRTPAFSAHTFTQASFCEKKCLLVLEAYRWNSQEVSTQLMHAD